MFWIFILPFKYAFIITSVFTFLIIMKINPNQFAFLPFFAKEWSLVSRLPTCLKDNKQIRDKKLTIIISKRKNGVIVTQLKGISTSPLRSSFKPCCTLICGKSRARKIAKFLRMLDALGTKLESLGFPWSSLYQKTWNNVPSNVLFFSQSV